MSDDTVAPYLFPAVSRKKVTAAFDGGRITSDGGVMLLAAAERRIGLADRLARLADPRNSLSAINIFKQVRRVARNLSSALQNETALRSPHVALTDDGMRRNSERYSTGF